MINLPNWELDPTQKETSKLIDTLNTHAKKLSLMINESINEEMKEAAVRSYYRKYYTLTLNKSCLSAGINRSPTRDIVLDFPWKDLNLNRIFCLKIWEKINH